MAKTKKIIAITSLFIFLGMFFILASNVLAADQIKYKVQIGFGAIKGEIPIGPDSIGTYITEVYKYAVGVVGILASIVIMWGGMRWLTAGGDSSAVKDAQDWIKGALSGLILVMTSYMILYFVNPDLIKFKSIKVDTIKTQASNSDPTTPAKNIITCGTENEGICVSCPSISWLPGNVCDVSAGCNTGWTRASGGPSCPANQLCCKPDYSEN